MEFTHGYRRVSGVGQRSAQQQAVLNDGGYNLHGGVEVGIGAAVFLGIAVVVPLAEDGEDGREAHGKQSMTEDDAGGELLSFHQGRLEPHAELLRMAFPLSGGEGDEGGGFQQQLVHLEEFLSQRMEVLAQIHASFAGGTRLPMGVELAGVDEETTVQTVFVAAEEAGELLRLPDMMSARWGRGTTIGSPSILYDCEISSWWAALQRMSSYLP